VEFALILPLLLLLILGIVELGLLVFAYDTIANAAREGARTGVIADATEQEACDAAVARGLGLNLTCDVVDPGTCPPSDPYNVCAAISREERSVRVEVTYDHQLLLGWIVRALGVSPAVEMHTVSTMRTE
jgi:hypothetical protein